MSAQGTYRSSCWEFISLTIVTFLQHYRRKALFTKFIYIYFSVICLAKTLKMTQNVLWTCLRLFLRSRSHWNLEYQEKSSPSNWERQAYLVHFASYKSEDWRLHSQAIILVTNLETLVWFCPSLMLIMGITVFSVLQNTRGSTFGKERSTFEWEQRCEEWM